MVESMKTDPLSEDANNGAVQWSIYYQMGVYKVDTNSLVSATFGSWKKPCKIRDVNQVS